MKGLGYGYGFPFKKSTGATLGQTMAVAHYAFNYSADPTFKMPAGVNSLAVVLNRAITANLITDEADFNAKLPIFADPHYVGYIPGAGSGITSGQAIKTLVCINSLITITQGTAGSMPLLLEHNGVNYFYNFNASGNSCSAPKALTQTDTLEFITKVDLTCGSVFQGYAIASIDNSSSSRSFYVIYNAGYFGLIYGSGLSQNVNATIPTAIYNGWFRCTLKKVGANSEIKFYKSDEFNITDKNLVNWVQIGATITGTYAAMSTTSSFFNILSGGVASNASHAKCYYAQISETIGGAPLAVFNPNEYNASISQTGWTSSITGEAYTINVGSATTGYKAVLVNRTIIQGDGVDDVLTTSSILNITLNTRFAAVNVFNISGGYIIHGKLSGTGDRHLWYHTGGNIQSYSGGGTINFSSISAHRLDLLTTDWNTTSSNNLTNNANQANGTLASENLNTLQLFGNGASSFKNCIINTIIETGSVSTHLQKTAMYNLIRSMNNNAF